MRSLVDREQSIARLQHAALAESTHTSYLRVQREFAEFCHASLTEKAKLKPKLILLFLEELFNRGKASATIRSAFSALAYSAKRVGRPDPTLDVSIQDFLKGCDRERPVLDTRLPFTLPQVHQVLVFWAASEPQQFFLFSAVTLLAFYGFFRISELCASNRRQSHTMLCVSDVSVTTSGLEISVSRFKHNRTQRPHLLHIHRLSDDTGSGFCPVRALEAYLKIRPSGLPGPLFYHDGFPLTQSVMSQALRSAVQRLGFSGRYTFHSLRIGGASWAFDQGWDEARIQRMGRWSSAAFKKYIRQASF